MIIATDSGRCFYWYHNIPESIECKTGTYFSIVCGVRVPCGAEADVDWYWSPVKDPNVTFLIENSHSLRSQVRTVQTSRVICTTNSSILLNDMHTLTLASLSSEHTGYYWCQMKVTSSSKEKTSPGNLLPSNQCYVSVANTNEDCNFKMHSRQWMCAQKNHISMPNNKNSYSHSLKSMKITNEIIPTTVGLNTKSIYSTPSHSSSADNLSDDTLINMSVTIVEIIFLLVIVVFSVIVAFLVGCLVKCRRRAKGNNYCLP